MGKGDVGMRYLCPLFMLNWRACSKESIFLEMRRTLMDIFPTMILIRLEGEKVKFNWASETSLKSDAPLYNASFVKVCLSRNLLFGGYALLAYITPTVNNVVESWNTSPPWKSEVEYTSLFIVRREQTFKIYRWSGMLLCSRCKH